MKGLIQYTKGAGDRSKEVCIKDNGEVGCNEEGWLSTFYPLFLSNHARLLSTGQELLRPLHTASSTQSVEQQQVRGGELDVNVNIEALGEYIKLQEGLEKLIDELLRIRGEDDL